MNPCYWGEKLFLKSPSLRKYVVMCMMKFSFCITGMFFSWYSIRWNEKWNLIWEHFISTRLSKGWMQWTEYKICRNKLLEYHHHHVALVARISLTLSRYWNIGWWNWKWIFFEIFNAYLNISIYVGISESLCLNGEESIYYKQQIFIFQLNLFFLNLKKKKIFYC